jgi:hypothetical protein
LGWGGTLGRNRGDLIRFWRLLHVAMVPGSGFEKMAATEGLCRRRANGNNVKD